MYGTGSERRSERANPDTAKIKREAGLDILNPQIQAMDEALDEDNSKQLSKKGQEDWQVNLATMSSQCPICNHKKRELPLPGTPHHHPTLPGMPTYVETSRNPIQRNRPEGSP